MTENPQDVNPADGRGTDPHTNRLGAGDDVRPAAELNDVVQSEVTSGDDGVPGGGAQAQSASYAVSEAPANGGWRSPEPWPPRPEELPAQGHSGQRSPDQPVQGPAGNAAGQSGPVPSQAQRMPAQPEDRRVPAGGAPEQHRPYGGYPQHGHQTPGQPLAGASNAQHSSAPAHHGHSAFGTPIPGAPVYPYAPGSQGGGGRRGSGDAPEARRRGSGKLLIAGLAIGALVGGATGAGTYAIVASQSASTVVSDSNGPQSITINDTNDVTRTSAIAAKAAPSVVTIDVAGPNAAGGGSGIILSEDGYVLTNNHVVTLDGMLSDPTIQVTDANGKLYSATVVGTDPVYDLAVIKLNDASGLTPMEFADSSKLNVGDVAVAIGAPLGLAGTVTDGIISALNRSITVASSAVPDDGGDTDEGQGKSPFDFNLPGQQPEQPQPSANISLAVIQTDAAINPGNSGGALVDAEGKLIGVNVAILGSGSNNGEQAGSIGLGFSIPSNIAERVAKEIMENGSATHGLLGASVKDAAADSSSSVVGALIDSVTPGGAAEAAGLRAGDIVTNFNGLPITSSTDLTAQVRALAAGEDAKLTYVRGSESHEVDVTLGTLVL